MLEETYRLTFTSITKAAKKLKILPLNKSLTLTEADDALKKLYTAVKEKHITDIELTMTLIGQEFGKSYFFEGIKLELDKAGRPSRLDSILANDILESLPSVSEKEANDLQQLSEDLAFQFKDEQDFPEHYISKRSGGKKKKFSVSNLFKKKVATTTEQKTDQEIVDSPVVTEKPIATTTPPSMTGKSELVAKQSAISYDDELPESNVGDTFTEQTELSSPVAIQPETGQPVEQENNLPRRVEVESIERHPNSLADIPTIQSYVDVTVVDFEQQAEQVMRPLKEKATQNEQEILKQLGLTTSSDDLLEQKRIEFVKEKMNVSFYNDELAAFLLDIAHLKNSTMQTLESHYEGSLLDYELFTKEKGKFQEELERKEKIKLDEKLSEFTKKQQLIQQDLRSNLLDTQQKEMTALQEKHARELATHDEQQRIRQEQEQIHYRESSQKAYDELISGRLRSYEQETKLSEAHRLSERKQNIISMMFNQLPVFQQEMAQREKDYITSLKQQLAEVEPDLKEEVKQLIAQQQRDKELAILEEKNRLKQDELALQKEKNHEHTVSKKDQESLLQEMIQQQAEASLKNNQLMTQMLQNMMLMQQNQGGQPPTPPTNFLNTEASDDSQEDNEKKLDETTKKKSFKQRAILGGSALALLIVGSFSYGVYQSQARRTLENHLTTVQAETTKQQKTYESTEKYLNDLLESMAAEKESEKIKSTTGSSDNVDLDSLIQEGDYLEAGHQFPSQLDTIEQHIFNKGDLAALETFIAAYPSTRYGKLDQAILKKDNQTVKQLYDYHIDREQLSDKQKEAIALSLYEVGRFEEANNLRGKMIDGGKG